MRAWLRLLLVGCLSLALPLQGMASASMAWCGAAHERAASAPVHGVAEPMPCHPSEAHATAADDVGPASHTDHSDQADDTDHADLGQHQCSTCAACCAAAALVPAMPVIAAPMELSSFFTAPQVTVALFATDGPDRPPRR